MLIQEFKTMTYSEILGRFTNEEFIFSRLDDLEKSGCIRKEKGVYLLNPEGKKLGAILECYQKIIGRRIGG